MVESRESQNYRPEIDGLRAIAVLGVLVYHFNPAYLPGGFFGVDVFFVISGYLISNIVISQINDHKFSLIEFFSRRAKRLFPALFIVLFATSIACWFTFTPHDFRDFGRSLVSVTTFSSNIFFGITWDYFAQWKVAPPLLHTWSLGVEEQFYLLFPALMLMLRACSPSAKFIVLSVATGLSIAFMFAGKIYLPTLNFYLLPSRAWELLVGCLLGGFVLTFDTVKTFRMLQRLLPFIGLVLVLVSFFLAPELGYVPGVATLIPVCGTALIICFASADGWVARMLSAKALVGVGLISYSLYLWHFPVLILTEYRFGWQSMSFLGSILSVVLIFLLSILTYFFVEKPLRHSSLPARRVLLISSAFIVATTLWGFFIHADIQSSRALKVNDGLEHLLEKARLPTGKPFSDCGGKVGGRICDVRAAMTESESKVLLLGDSFMEDLLLALSKSTFVGDGQVEASIVYACDYASDSVGGERDPCTRGTLFAENLTLDDYGTVIFSINFSDYMYSASRAEASRLIDRWTRTLENLVLRDINVYVVTPRRTYANIDPPRAAIFGVTDKLEAVSLSSELADAFANLRAIGVCQIGIFNFDPQIDPYLIYRDKGHFSVSGSEIWLAEALNSGVYGGPHCGRSI